jgi:hypothetical protein
MNMLRFHEASALMSGLTIDSRAIVPTTHSQRSQSTLITETLYP